MNKAVIFLRADPQFAGERDYMNALLAHVAPRQLPDTRYLIAQLSQTYPAEVVFSTAFPDKDAAMPVTAAWENTTDLTLIGAGHSTLQPTLNLAQSLAREGKNPAIGYITHRVDSAADLRAIRDNAVTLFAPVNAAELRALDNTLPLDLLQTLDAVPHTQGLECCVDDHAAFMSGENGQKVTKMKKDGKKLAVVILNAGFTVDGAHLPYTLMEARLHGLALGGLVPPGTPLLAVHGGPRNLLDEAAGHLTMSGFTSAYRERQSRKGAAPPVLQERYGAGQGYNPVKAAYLIKNCSAWIPNAESYGTVDGARLHVDPDSTLLALLPFAAINADPTGQRQAHLAKCNADGMTILNVGAKSVEIISPPLGKRQNEKPRDAAAQIAAFYKLTL